MFEIKDGIVPHSTLARGAVGLPTVLMQSIAQIAPALGMLATLGFNTQLAGLAAPSTYLVAFGIALMVAATLAQLAQHLPSAGGFYTYVSATLGPSVGFLVGWIYMGFVAAIPGAIAAFVSSVLSERIAAGYGIHIPWAWFAVVIITIATLAAYRGIRVSGAALMVSSLIEMLIVLALAVSGLASPGAGGFSFAGLNPAASESLNGFALAVVFSIFAFTGWEGAAALAEETREPRRQIPRAIVGSVILLGFFYALCAWGLQVGWGTHELRALADANELPAFAVAQRLWGAGWVLVLIALLNSGIAVCIACTVDATRNGFAMARAGALPSWLAFVHARHRTPSHAVLAQAGVALAVALGLGMSVGPQQTFFVLGLVGTLVYAVVYCLGNIGVMRYFLTVRRAEWRPVLHGIFPVLSSLTLLSIAFVSLYPLPAPPVRYAPLIALVLLLAGVAILLRLRASRRDDWKQLSQQVFEG
jgi:amino acid transporter